MPRVGGRCPGDRGARRRLCARGVHRRLCDRGVHRRLCDRGVHRRLCDRDGCRCLCVRDDCRRPCGLIDLRSVSVSMGPCCSICILFVLRGLCGRSGCSVSTWHIVRHRNCRHVVAVRGLSRRRVRVVVLLCAFRFLSSTRRVCLETCAFRCFRTWPLVWEVFDPLSLAGLLPPFLGVFY